MQICHSGRFADSPPVTLDNFSNYAGRLPRTLMRIRAQLDRLVQFRHLLAESL